jgi:hypothetical protein
MSRGQSGVRGRAEMSGVDARVREIVRWITPALSSDRIAAKR